MSGRVGPWRSYGGEEMPLAGYGALVASWSAIFGGVAAALARRGSLPRAGLGDVLLLGVATHKLTRILTKDWVTRSAPPPAPGPRMRAHGPGSVR